MKTIHFPYIALAMGVFLLLAVVIGGETGSDENTLLPLLTLLIISEFAFFVTAIAAFIGFKHLRSAGMQPAYTVATVLCGVLSVLFMRHGLMLWPF